MNLEDTRVCFSRINNASTSFSQLPTKGCSEVGRAETRAPPKVRTSRNPTRSSRADYARSGRVDCKRERELPQMFTAIQAEMVAFGTVHPSHRYGSSSFLERKTKKKIYKLRAPQQDLCNRCRSLRSRNKLRKNETCDEEESQRTTPAVGDSVRRNMTKVPGG